MKRFETYNPMRYVPTPILHSYIRVVVHLRGVKLVYVTARAENMSIGISLGCAVYQFFTNGIVPVTVTFKNKD